jgi:predicted RND superfamily exporter protein
VAEIVPEDENVFVFGRDFLYWEEVGTIREELVRNLLICAAVVCAIVALMIPRPRLALMTIFCIVMSIIDVLGFCYYLDITISGISTVYILIAVGLAVDYSAHIAHAFNHATGTSSERCLDTLGRIGPCVWHAFFTLFLACVPLSFSTTYLFRVFFKVFFLVAFMGGTHGLFLLPVLLALFGGDKLAHGTKVTTMEVNAETAVPEKADTGWPKSDNESNQGHP